MNTSKCDLGDPQWELVDPTPNVHALFVQFNAKFFWGKLCSVSVRWSKRMYSCAGICRYEGRGGLCDIGLSEPLLKLRPRKDLVETLLHEMIHAYLFLTDRDRDRDGHGPNFQSHMRRINKAANVNITIYHDFHDEVRLYKTHWWRCNGPCQTRHPFFGLVKRTTNRAPGHNDFWWSQHQSTCGGSFVKIREPEKKQKTKGDRSKKENIGKNNHTRVPKVNTIEDLPSTSQSATKMNGGKTNVINITQPVRKSPQTLKDYWGGNGSALKPNENNNKDNVANTVRNHWANKQIPENNVKTLKRHSSVTAFETPPAKIAKINLTLPNTVTSPENFTINDANAILKDIYGDSFTLDERKYDNIFSPPKPTPVDQITADNIIDVNCKIPVENTTQVENVIEIDPDVVNCPVCNNKVHNSVINSHLDICITQTLTKCSLCNQNVSDLAGHAKLCCKLDPDFEECSHCQNIVVNLNSHLRVCPNRNMIHDLRMASCPSCQKRIPQSEINDHLDICLTQGGVEIDEDSVSVQKCPVCNVETPKLSLEDHLTLCVSQLADDMTSDMESSVDDDDDFNESLTYNDTGTKYPCPCCMHMVESNMMDGHIYQCLNAK